MKSNGVCPTYVGMNRRSERTQRHRIRMPHVCGDEPKMRKRHADLANVCPTYVGMNRLHGWKLCLMRPYAPRMWG